MTKTNHNSKFLLFLLQIFAVSHGFSPVRDIFSNKSNTLPEGGNGVSVCELQLKQFTEAMDRNETWALKMFDSSAKFQSGILAGNIASMGNYDECLEIDEIVQGQNIKGKYCTTVLQLNENVNGTAICANIIGMMGLNRQNFPKWGSLAPHVSVDLCIPQVCSAEEMQQVLNSNGERQLPVRFLFTEAECTTSEERRLSTVGIVALVAAGLSSALTVASTLYDILVYQKKNDDSEDNEYDWMIFFSWYTNTKRLFSFKTREATIPCLNGIRVISMMWISLGHRFFITSSLPNINWLYLFEWERKVENTVIHGVQFSVDTFLLISGLLTVYVYLLGKDSNTKINIFRFYFHRILRLFPPLAATILLHLYIMEVARGPFWPRLKLIFYNHCNDYWWSTLLFIQNYYNPLQLCLWHSWFLAVDTQLYFAMPLMIALYLRFPKVGVFLVTTGVSLCSFFAAHVTWKYNLGVPLVDISSDTFQFLYVPTHTRMTPYLIGTTVGYFLYKYRKIQVDVPQILSAILWIVSLGTLLTVVLIRVELIKYGTTSEFTIYNACSTVAWSIALMCIIFLCVNGNGGFINSLLSARIFNVMVRLNYSMYLINLYIIGLSLGSKRTPNYISDFDAMHAFWGDYFYTLVVSVIWTLTFESPITALESYLLYKDKKGHEVTLTSFSAHKKTKTDNFDSLSIIRITST